MKKSIEAKLQHLFERFQEVNQLLSEPSIIAQQKEFKALSKEYAHLEPIANDYEAYQKIEKNLSELIQMASDLEPSIAALAHDEIPLLTKELATLEAALQQHLLPKDPDDENNVYLEIRAGTGGDEAAIFVGDLFRMYARYAESQSWQLEIINQHHAEQGGFKEIIAKITGTHVYAKLKFESGAHRVQRVPITESQGRVHTSACTVAILPEVSEIDEIAINPDELRIDTYRSSGAGGQHINKTDSAIRITHLPTGTVVECQDERSQHKNRAKAMSLLKTRLLNAEQNKQKQEQAQIRKSLVGSGDRSERIRTYNYPQGRLTDHRINLTLYQLLDIMEGQLTPVIEALQKEHYAALLSEMNHYDDH